MENSIRINSSKLPIREYNGQRVVTFKDIDAVHSRKDGTAHRNFKANRNRFIEGVDYFRLQRDEIRPFGITSPNGGIVITESGYLMLAKSFTDDLAWKVQRELVNNYFRDKTPAEPEKLTLETEEYHYFKKTYDGEPVITLLDFEHFTEINVSLAYRALARATTQDDFTLLEYRELMRFKVENHIPLKWTGSALIVIKRSGVEKLLNYFCCTAEIPMTEEKKPLPAVEVEPGTAKREPKYVTTDDAIIALEVLRYVKEHNESCKRYDHIAAIERAIKDVGMLIAAGY